MNLQLGHEVQGIDCQGSRVTRVTVAAGGSTRTVTADHYVAALPAEVMSMLVTEAMRRAEPRLAGIARLVTRWMNGIMFYLDRDVPLVDGHAIYIDSEWALTSISQRQFWPEVDLESMGDGRTEGILSVDVSDWGRPGRRTGKAASKCTAQEIADEVWSQLKDHLNQGELTDDNLVGYFLDPDIQFPNPSQATNLEPLLVNTAGSWDDRPDAVTAIPNLYLASDYVRTYTDLATMEGANEAARRAVNGILDSTGSSAEPCPVWRLREPDIFAPARAIDRIRWRLRRPPRPRLKVAADGRLEPSSRWSAVLMRRPPRRR